MEMPKATDEDKERFRNLIPDAPTVEVKPMFGNLGAFVNGNMFAGLFGSDIGLKLNDADRETLLAEEGSGPFGPADRPMGSYATIPADWTDTRACEWVELALSDVAAMAPKIKKSKAKRTK